MTRKTRVLLCVVVFAVALPAGAEFGTFSITPAASASGDWMVDVSVTVDTNGSLSTMWPYPWDMVGVRARLYYPYTWSTAHPSFSSTSSFRASGRTTSGGFPFHRVENFSLTPATQTAGDWGVFVLVRGLEYGATTWTLDYPYYHVDGPHTLPEQLTATITGTVAHSPARPDAANITVSANDPVSGLPMAIVSTDALGDFTLVLVSGTYDIVASYASFLDVEYSDLAVVAGVDDNLGSTVLLGGDVNSDGTINITDISTVAAAFGTADAVSDLNGDGTVNITDITAVATYFGVTGPTAW